MRIRPCGVSGPIGAAVLAIAVGLLALAPVSAAEEKHPFEAHEWSVWIADPTVATINLQAHYNSAMPGGAESQRSRRAPSGEKRPSPISMLSFYGQPLKDLEIELQLPAGRWLAYYPSGAEIKGQRLRWLEVGLVPRPTDQVQLTYVAPDHWFQQARKVGELFVRKGERLEGFLAYDAELSFVPPLALEGGPDSYHVSNRLGTPLHDVLISEPTPQGRRIGWLDQLSTTPRPAKPVPAANASAPAAGGAIASNVRIAEPKADAKPTADTPATGGASTIPGRIEQPEAAAKLAAAVSAIPVAGGAENTVTMSAPLAAGSTELAAASTGELTKRLEKAGLKPDEVALLAAQYKAALFDSKELVVAVRLGQNTLDEKLPLTFYPEPQRTVRVALVITRNADPKVAGEVQKLIAELGDRSYAKREAAQKRLTVLGTLAQRTVKEALSNSDPEIVVRAERVLLDQGVQP